MTQALSLLYSRSEPDAVKNNQWKDAEKILRGFSLQNICISDLHKTVYVYDKQGIDFKLRVWLDSFITLILNNYKKRYEN